MDHCGEAVLLKKLPDEFAVTDITGDQFDRSIDDCVAVTENQVIEHDNAFSECGKMSYGMGADISGTSCD
jgi:hypothetical protein